MQTKQADRENIYKVYLHYNRFHKETLLKFRYNVFTCHGNGKISAIVAAREATIHFQKYCNF